MRNKRWLRYGIGSLAVGSVALCALLVACGDDDSSSSGGVNPDGGQDQQAPPGNDGGTDTGTDARPDSGKPANIVLVHAATDLGPSNPSGAVRVCFATATKANPTDADFAPTPLGALPDTVPDGGSQPFPGIFIGTGGPFAGTGTPLEPITIRPYVMNAQRLAAGGVVGNAAEVPRCSKLLAADAKYPDGGEALKENVDYWRLADIPAGTLKQDKTYMLAVVGCTQDAVLANVASSDCGGGFTPDGGAGAGNLKILILELDQGAVGDDAIGIQNVNLSPSHHKLKSTGGSPPYLPTIGNAETVDASAPDANKHVASPNGAEVAFDEGVTAPTAMVKIVGLTTDTAYWALNPTFLAGTPAGVIPLHNKASQANPPVSVQRFSTGSSDPNAPAIYVNGQAYTFVLVGDPLEPADNPSRQTRRLHYLAFPNKP